MNDDELWNEVCDIVQETGIKDHPHGKEMQKKQNGDRQTVAQSNNGILYGKKKTTNTNKNKIKKDIRKTILAVRS